MTAIASYLRHLIVAGILILVAKYKLPVEGADEFANAVALIAIGTATWAIVKYAPALARIIGLTGPAILIVGLLTSCMGMQSVPIKGCIVTQKGTICYSSKGGLEVEVDATSGK